VVRIYLDACCLNRPFDDQTQARIHLEAEAVLTILSRFVTGDWEWLGSEVIDLEIGRTPDPERRRRVRLLASHAHEVIHVRQAEIQRARQLEAWGISAFDALHVACAESGGADAFLTTDDRLLSRLIEHAGELSVRVENPLAWVGEVG
jgi:predicted nucleic acid-binding protein